jgi:hypothetical protein
MSNRTSLLEVKYSLAYLWLIWIIVQIHFVLLISRQGKVRLTKWYSPYSQKERTKVLDISYFWLFLSQHEILISECRPYENGICFFVTQSSAIVYSWWSYVVVLQFYQHLSSQRWIQNYWFCVFCFSSMNWWLELAIDNKGVKIAFVGLVDRRSNFYQFYVNSFDMHCYDLYFAGC